MADSTQGFTYSVDLVLVIDATGSMASIIERVKKNALAFHEDLQKKMEELGRHIDSLRVRVIAFRDYYADSAPDSLVTSDFFVLPEQSGDYSAFVSNLRATGGGDEPETAMEGLAEAIRSPWANEGSKQRQVIIVWTDASAHKLEKNAGSQAGRVPDRHARQLRRAHRYVGRPGAHEPGVEAPAPIHPGRLSVDRYQQQLGKHPALHQQGWRRTG